MRGLTFSSALLVALTFLLALLLSIVPLSKWGVVFWPQWVALLLIYWVIAFPYQINLGTAWILGLLLDGLYGSLLGEHAFALSVVAYLTYKVHRQLRMFPRGQQALCVFVLLIIYQALLFWVQGMIGQLPSIRWLWVSSFISMLIWPLLCSMLQAYQRRFSFL